MRMDRELVMLKREGKQVVIQYNVLCSATSFENSRRIRSGRPASTTSTSVDADTLKPILEKMGNVGGVRKRSCDDGQDREAFPRRRETVARTPVNSRSLLRSHNMMLVFSHS